MVGFRYERELPITDEVDILVGGGGIAGVSAAIAAARQGARTMLVERHAVLGGTATTGGVGSFCGETGGQGEVFDDIAEGLSQLHAIAPYRPYAQMEARAFNHQVLPIVLQELALAAGVEILLHSWILDVDYIRGVIQHVVILGKSGLEVIRPKFVIDCTGEADIVHSAGLPTLMRREGDRAQLPMSLMFFMRDTGDQVTPALPEGCEPLDEGRLPMLSVFTEEGGPAPGQQGVGWVSKGQGSFAGRPTPVLRKLAVKTKVVGHDSTDSRSLSSAELSARRQMFSVIQHLQRTKFPTYELDHVAAQIGIREGRRVQGEYVLTEQDVKRGRRTEDGIALGVFYLDAWDPDTERRAYIADQQGEVKFQPPPYHVPFRSLQPKGTRNLLVAGRCLSADQMAMSSARVMTTASMMGHAAGIAAAMCVDRREDTRSLDVQALRAILVDKKARLS